MDPESDPDPIGSELFAGSGVGSGINHFGSESTQLILLDSLLQEVEATLPHLVLQKDIRK